MRQRREARLERKNQKILEQQAKSARLLQRFAEEDSVRLGSDNSKGREIRIGADPGSIFGMKVLWSDSKADKIDSWSWGVPRDWGDDAWSKIILPKLNHWAELYWREIDQITTDSGHKAHHSMPTDVLRDEAQYRMVELDQWDDEVFRFRLGNRRRLWGFRIVNEFQILWYDPTHEIYPTDPD